MGACIGGVSRRRVACLCTFVYFLVLRLRAMVVVVDDPLHIEEALYVPFRQRSRFLGRWMFWFQITFRLGRGAGGFGENGRSEWWS